MGVLYHWTGSVITNWLFSSHLAVTQTPFAIIMCELVPFISGQLQDSWCPQHGGLGHSASMARSWDREAHPFQASDLR